ncbi:hypothetical protein GQ44DRAFT_733416 [Phaeosphaeriaceae sp. PMI808]|nr:hypothetical protein GQ44DRAFT_733416 [Phaeosphaeriaceae sp. PMI808]
MILAALHSSQFARILESWGWISSACRITVALIKADYSKLTREFYLTGESGKTLISNERYRLDMVLFIYWICVQLESDIMAELSTSTASSVTAYQYEIMYLAGVSGKETLGEVPEKKKPAEEKNLMIYSIGNKSFDSNNFRAFASRNSHVALLENWRRTLPHYLAWKDEDPLSTDLNTASMRAKYYGNLHMMLRNYLRIVVTYEWPLSHQSAHWSHYNSPATIGETFSTTTRGVQMAGLSDDERNMIQVACLCINSAIQSTVAFDRVGASKDNLYEGYISMRTTRPATTNIFGTLHAQFGNMLVLAAVYKSKLHKHLPCDTPLTAQNLHALFEHTF